MVRRWDQWRDPWDREYAKRGRLWRGRADPAPIPELLPSPARVLEVGCGDGKFLAELERLGHGWVGLDSSPRALRLVRERLPGAPTVQGDARRLPFNEGRFDAVVARYLLGALLAPGRAEAAGELVRVLRPGGFIVVEEFSMEDFRRGKGDEVEAGTFERNAGITTHYFDAKELRSLFPGLEPLREEELRHELRVEGARVPRVAIRVALRKIP